MFEKILMILGIICTIIGIVCVFFPSASFGVLFFLSLGIAMLGLTFCIKISNLNIAYSKFFEILSLIGKIVLGLWLISFIIIETMIIVGEKSDDQISFDALIVLGAGIYGDVPSLSFQTRLDTAINYLNGHPETIVITTGGYGEGEAYSESYVAKKYLVENGIDENRILFEEYSRNTFENVRYAKELLPDDYSGKTAAVSNDFHLFRARMLLEVQGLTPYAIGSEIPNRPALNILYSIREYFSVVKHLLFER
ncbi:MAG: YdcF family protein [Clostridia bacterium]